MYRSGHWGLSCDFSLVGLLRSELENSVQLSLFEPSLERGPTPTWQVAPFRTQLLKWIGNKQRYACQIANLMPEYHTYIEPFLGSGAVLGTLSPRSAIAGDILDYLSSPHLTLIFTCSDLSQIRCSRKHYERSVSPIMVVGLALWLRTIGQHHRK